MCAPEGPPAVGLPAGLGASRPVTEADVQKVHVMIEACLRRCLTKQQTQAVLSQRFGVQPAFSGLVWDRLEAENAEWFAGYRQQLKTLAQLHSLQLAA